MTLKKILAMSYIVALVLAFLVLNLGLKDSLVGLAIFVGVIFLFWAVEVLNP